MTSFKDYINKINEEGEGGGDIGGSVEIDQGANSTANIDKTEAPIGFYSRLSMPQIYSYLYPHFVADLSINNIPHDKKILKKKDLVPSQKEFKQDKVDSIRKSIEDGTYKAFPLLVSSDMVIVDGHHRWHALNENDKCEVNMVGLNFEKLYEFLKNKPYAINKPLNENDEK